MERGMSSSSDSMSHSNSESLEELSELSESLLESISIQISHSVLDIFTFLIVYESHNPCLVCCAGVMMQRNVLRIQNRLYSLWDNENVRN